MLPCCISKLMQPCREPCCVLSVFHSTVLPDVAFNVLCLDTEQDQPVGVSHCNKPAGWWCTVDPPLYSSFVHKPPHFPCGAGPNVPQLCTIRMPVSRAFNSERAKMRLIKIELSRKMKPAFLHLPRAVDFPQKPSLVGDYCHPGAWDS